MKESRLLSLIVQHISGKLDLEEARELEGWASEHPANQQLLERMTDEVELEKEIDQFRNIDPEKGFQKWRADHARRQKMRIIKIGGWVAAASLVLIVIANAISHSPRPVPGPEKIVKVSPPIPPGRNTAILTLSDGKQVLLDSSSNGLLANQGNVRLIKPDSSSISYQSGHNDQAAADLYNVLRTPRSGQYQLTLADGSRVWLNNVSSLRYPTAFAGKDRVVELDGEAYFEIAHDPGKPFIVKVRNQSIEVLATSFNIMAYSDEESSQTTLLSGAVRVRAASNTVQLKPDEQVQVNSDGVMRIPTHVDGQEVISWKNGFFYVGRASFASVMRQLARWYNVDVVYDGKVPASEYVGKIDRQLPLDDVLKYLEKSQVHFRLEGRKLIVVSQ